TLPERASHPWAGRVWAKSRIDDVLEEMALTRNPPAELKNEIIELGLAYNLITPYTSFLAVPESELTGEHAMTLAQMRQQRAKVVAAKAAGGAVHVRVDAAEPARRVTAALISDPSGRTDRTGVGRVFEGDFPMRGMLRVVVADMAHNETAREVEPR